MVKSEMVLSSAIDVVRKIAVASVQLEMTLPKRRNHSLTHIVCINKNNIELRRRGNGKRGNARKKSACKKQQRKNTGSGTSFCQSSHNL